MSKYCVKCGNKEVRKLYCEDCRRDVALTRLRDKWQNDENYRERHRLAARLSFRRRRGKMSKSAVATE